VIINDILNLLLILAEHLGVAQQLLDYLVTLDLDAQLFMTHVNFDYMNYLLVYPLVAKIINELITHVLNQICKYL
jgi:hypothetical protein